MSPINPSSLAVSVSLACIALLASGNSDFLESAALSAGSFTTAETGANAFSVPVAMLSKVQAEQFLKGKEQFNEAWVVAPEPGGA